MTLTFKRIVVPLLACSLLFSCSASQHAGVTNIIEPPISENDQSVWFLYYQDQFDAFNGSVLSPSFQYPESAHQGCNQAKDEWNKKVKYARGRTTLAYMSGGLICGAGIIFGLTALMKHEHQPIRD